MNTDIFPPPPLFSNLVLHFRSNNPQSSLTLTGCNNIQRSGTVGVKFFLTESDLRALQLDRNLGTSNTNSYLTVAPGNGFRAQGTTNELRTYTSLQAIQTSSYTPDTTRPRVQENGFVEFDLDSGQFTIAFDEPVDITSIVVPATLRFQHHSDVSLSVDAFEVRSLSCPGCPDGENMTFTLPREELNRLKLTPRVCTSAATCWLTILSPGNFIRDMAGNAVVQLPNGLRTPSRYLGNFVDDTTGPLLEFFTLNLTSRELILMFDEPIDSSSFDITGITVQGGRGVADESLYYRLSSSTPQSGDGVEMRILLSDADVNALQSRPLVATAQSNTFLSLDPRTVVDLSYQANPAQAISNTSAIQASMHMIDVAPPEIRAFDLDFNTNTMTLVFSEPVLVSSLNLGQLVLQSSRLGEVSRRLGGGQVHPTALDASAEVIFTLTNPDATFLEVRDDIASSETNTYLSAMAGLAEDTNAVSSVQVPTSEAIRVRNFIRDTSAPSVINFALDTNSGEMVVTFNDVINASTFDVSAVTLQSAIYRVPMQWHTLSQSSSSHSFNNGFGVTIFLGMDDLNRVKQIRNLATSRDNTYLTVAATIADDVNGEDTIAVTDGKSLQVSAFTGDTTRPVVEDWTLEMDSGQIILTFSETVDIRTLQPSEITIQVARSTTDSYPLTDFSALIPPDADYRFAIQLAEADANFIKAHTGLGTSQDNSYLTISAAAIADTSSNAVVAILNGQALQAGTFVSDGLSPVLRSFSLDLNSGLLRLTFDETVYAGSFNVSALALVNRGTRPNSRHVPINSTPSTTNSSVMVVTLAKTDLDAIKAITDLATTLSDTFLTADSFAVRDMNDNLLTEITSDAAVQASMYTQDTTPPQLESFSLNLSSEEIVLTFSETVQVSSLDPTQITIQQLPSRLGRTITLSGGTTSQGNAAVVTLRLTEEDANALKLYRDIATLTSNTFISLTPNTIRDPASNLLVAVPSTNARRVNVLTQDTVSPRLVSFSLDLNQTTLSLTFDETIDSSTFSIISVGLQDRMTNPTQSVRLGARSTTQSTDGTVFMIRLSADDFNAISAMFPLATMETNTYLTLLPATVLDTNGNPSIEVPTNNALRITSHTADTTRPSLSAFDFDLNLGIVTLVFSESVNASTFNPTQVTFQSAPSSPLHTFSLTGGQISQPESTTIDIDLLRNDLNTIKAMTDLASLASNTYISITSATVRDMNTNMVTPVSMSNAQLVREFTQDRSGPILERFDLDYDNGALTLYFDETVTVDTLQTSTISFQAADTLTGNSHTLFNSTRLDSGLLTVARVQLSNSDLNELKRLQICSTPTSCYISVTRTLVEDVASNQNIEITGASPRPVSNHIQDTTNPRVLQYHEFDLNSGIFTFAFSETVDVSTLNQSQIELHSDYINSSHIFTFEGLSPIGSDSHIVTFQLGSEDLNRLKLNTDLCTHSGNCWVRFSSEFLSDMLGNPIQAIEPNTIASFHQPRVFTPDTTRPQLLSYTIDLDSGRMTFTFDEVIRLATFTPMNITFQDAPIATSSINLREPGSSFRSEDGLSVVWSMTIPDLNLLKAYERVFASVESSYVTYDYLIEDESGNGIAQRSDGISALQASDFSPDTTRPRLQSFLAFNFDNWTFTLQFDEPVNLSSINLQEIAIARNRTLDLHIYDPIRINDWYSLYYENGSVYNLTHLFEPGEYILSCPFSLDPTTQPPTLSTTSLPQVGPEGSGNFSSSGSGSGSGLNLTFMEDLPTMPTLTEGQYPILLRGCSIYRNLTVVEPFYFLTGGELSYVDERKQQVQVAFNRDDLRFLKISDFIASNDNTTWIAYNATVLSDMSENAVVPTNLFNATKLEDRAFVNDVTPPVLEFVVLDLDSDVLSLHFSDVMDVQSIDPTVIQIWEFPLSNNSYVLQGPYDPPRPLTVDTRDNYTIDIALSFDDMNTLKNNLELATSELNTFISFPSTVATDIYSQNPIPVTPQSAVRVRTLVPDMTGPILVAFDLDLNTGILNLTFNEVVNPSTINTAGITIQNFRNSSTGVVFESHTLIGGEPLLNDTGVVTLELQLDLDLSALKILPNLANDINDTFIRIEFGTILDMNDNENQPITDGEALQISNIVEDTSPPFLLYFDLNLNDNFLILKFSEAVRTDTFNISGITLQSAPTQSADIQVLDSNSFIFTQEFSTLVYVRFTAADEDLIKENSRALAKSRDSTYLSIELSTAEDFFGFQVLNISEENAVQVRLYFEGGCLCVCVYVCVCVCGCCNCVNIPSPSLLSSLPPPPSSPPPSSPLLPSLFPSLLPPSLPPPLHPPPHYSLACTNRSHL